ncbi:GGDEF domain-containing protein [Vibrio amylolyticus]|uniref:GGDEF domain-containing protein n=1 Tax=Vibrio amylolyticus TaxID=2847292 RepID=UPI00354CC24D
MKYLNAALPFLITTFVLSFVSLSFGFQRYQTIKQESLDRGIEEAMDQVNHTYREYRFIRTQVISIAELLTNNQAMNDYVLSPTLFNKTQLEKVWSSTMIHQRWFPHIRYVDDLGKELVGVTYDSLNEGTSTTDALGNHSHEDFIRLAQSLASNQVGSWGADLEFEIDSTSSESTPVFHIISPIITMDKTVGYLILNLDIGYLSSRFNFNIGSEFRPELVSDKGLYIDKHKTNLPGHVEELEAGVSLADSKPQVWSNIQNRTSGYEFDEGALYAYKKLDVADTQSFYIIVEASKETLASYLSTDLKEVYREVALVFLVLLLFSLPAVFVFLHFNRRNLESKLARAAIDGMSAVIITDKQHRVVMVNQEFNRMTGLTSRRVLRQSVFDLLSDQKTMAKMKWVIQQLKTQNQWEGEFEIKNRQGGVSTLITRIQAIHTLRSEVDYYITTFVDISERKQLEDRLRLLSEKDELTGLFNRRKFEQALSNHAQIVGRYQERSPVCIALFDIDFFKMVNDEKGHDEGDRVIRNVASILEDNLRQTDIIARIGGEEFAIILPNTNRDEAEPVLERLRVAVSESELVPVTVSGGYTDLTENSTDSYKRADIALYKAKDQGRDKIAVVSSSDN